MPIETLGSLTLAAGTDIGAVAKAEVINDGSTSTHPSFSLIQAMGGQQTTSGVRVTPASAMGVVSVNACVRIISESVAAVPLILYRRDGKAKQRASDHPLYRVLHDAPNPWMSSFEWRELMQRHCGARGNAYSLIERNSRGDVMSLYPLDPDKVTVLKGNDLLPYYRVQEIAGSPVVSHEDVFHVKDASDNPYLGKSRIRECMEAVGLTMATEQFGASLFGNGALHRGFWLYKGSLKPDQLKTVRESLEERYVGLKNANRPGILDGDWTWVSTSMAAEEAQFLESRNFGVEEIARLYRMPAVMIGHADKTMTYASAEQFFLAFVVHTMLPWYTRWEQAIKRALLTSNETDLYAEFLVDGLLRGDINARYKAYALARQWGWLCADEIREKENENPLPNGAGQRYLEPLNMIEAAADSADERGANSLRAMDLMRLVMRQLGPQVESQLEGQVDA